MTKETDLYAPVKTLLETKGYVVKSEVKGCDVVGLKDTNSVIVELKLVFSLDLVLQGIARQSLTDDVYLAIFEPDTPQKRKNWRSRQRGCLKLCRMLGLGLMLVTPEANKSKLPKILLDPAEYKPRKNRNHQVRLMKEFETRTGDPNVGGVNRKKIMTAYRQDALRCAMVLKQSEKLKLSEIKKTSGVDKASSILQKNHYNWFIRHERGIYGLTSAGLTGLETYADALATLMNRIE